MDKYVCTICGYVYDEEKGDIAQGVAPRTRFSKLPEDWFCEQCEVGKEEFEKK